MVQRLDPIYTDFTIAEPDIPLVRQHLNGPPLQVLTESENDKLPPRVGQLTFIDNAVQPSRARSEREPPPKITIVPFGHPSLFACG